MKYVLIPAIDAYAYTVTLQEDPVERECEAIELRIRNAAYNGHFETSIDKITEEAKSELLSKGYEVEKEKHDTYPYSCFVISWRNLLK